jgi:hypothetical protein
LFVTEFCLAVRPAVQADPGGTVGRRSVRRRAQEAADDAVQTLLVLLVVEVNAAASAEYEAPNRRSRIQVGLHDPDRAVPVRARESDQDDRVVADGERVRRGARLRIAVDRHGLGDVRQRRQRRDRLDAASRDVELDGVGPRVRVGVEDRLAQRSRAAVGGRGYGVGGADEPGAQQKE